MVIPEECYRFDSWDSPCRNSNDLQPGWKWKHFGYYCRRTGPKRVRRFQCKACGITFSFLILSDDLSVFLNDGDGGFASRTDYPAGVGTYAATAADVDGDEDLDLVHANVNSNTISIRLDAGDGTFGSRTDYVSGNFPNALVAVDLDEVGDLDVATANRYSDDVSVFLNLSAVGVDDFEVITAVTRLLPNYPNPFNPRTTLVFDLAKPTQQARLAIYNLQGSLVRTLVNESMDAGRHEVVWTGRNERGQSVASGVYMARLETGDATQMCKLILLK